MIMIFRYFCYEIQKDFFLLLNLCLSTAYETVSIRSLDISHYSEVKICVFFLIQIKVLNCTQINN